MFESPLQFSIHGYVKWHVGKSLGSVIIPLVTQPFRYHHITVLGYTWFTYESYDATSRWFMVMNYLVHSLMYTYYGLKVSGLSSVLIFISNTADSSCKCLIKWLIFFFVTFMYAKEAQRLPLILKEIVAVVCVWVHEQDSVTDMSEWDCGACCCEAVILLLLFMS